MKQEITVQDFMRDMDTYRALLRPPFLELARFFQQVAGLNSMCDYIAPLYLMQAYAIQDDSSNQLELSLLMRAMESDKAQQAPDGGKFVCDATTLPSAKRTDASSERPAKSMTS
jgi:hypothetical protein